MIKHVTDFLFGMIAKMFFGAHQPAAPGFDLDAFFDRISDTGEKFIDRLQKVFIAALAVAGLATLAVTVLTVRIFQLSSSTTVRVFGLFDMDGALFFGVLLAIGAGAIGLWIAKSTANPVVAKPRPEFMMPPPPQTSPLESALADLIRSHIENQSAPSRTEAPPARESWNPAPPMSASAPPPDDDIHSHDA